MSKLSSPTQVTRALKREGMAKIPTTIAISKLYRKFLEFGTVLDSPRSGRPKISDDKATGRIREILEENPGSTLTSISKETGVSRSTISRRIKTEIGMFPYKIQIHQSLEEDDFDKRVELAERLLPILHDPFWGKRIYFSDECTFQVSGRVHKHNCRIWGYEKPNQVSEEPLHSEKVNVWCAISATDIIGPYFFDEDTVNGANYLKMLKLFFYPELQRMRITRQIIFQQDGAPAHYAVDVRRWLDQNLTQRWIGRRGMIEWAPRSPDLTPCDFFLWEYLKQKVYSKTVKDFAHLRRRIAEEVVRIEPETLKKVFLNIEKWLTLVIDNDGRHIEQFL